MNDSETATEGRTGLSLRPGNPDGKGAGGFMLDWYRSEPRGVAAKPRRQLLAEFFTSMLVLSARFGYKPAVGVPNYLYLVDEDWELSLIAPQEWSGARREGFAGTCVLQPDMTWTIEPSLQLAENPALATALGRFYDAFVERMDTDLTLEEILPAHVARLPYYPRLYANALSRSLRATMILSDTTSLRSRDWRLLLPLTGEPGEGGEAVDGVYELAVGQHQEEPEHEPEVHDQQDTHGRRVPERE